MKRKINKLFVLSLLTSCMLISGCSDSDSSGDSGLSAGKKQQFTAAGVNFNMAYAPGGKTFPVGEDDSWTAKVDNAYWIGETEVTVELLTAILQWAYNNGKFSTVAGAHNELNSSIAKYGGQVLMTTIYVLFSGGNFTIESGKEKYPALYVSWYGAVIFCNWLTEMIDGNNENVVYTGIDEDWVDTETGVKSDAKGFRLPINDEWEMAARYLDGTNWLPGNHTSGDTSGYCYPDDGGQSTAFGDYCWYDGNSSGADHDVGKKKPNFLGMCDMNGSRFEWCFDGFNSGLGYFIYELRGGSGNSGALYMQLGFRGYTVEADVRTARTGFRLAKSQ